MKKLEIILFALLTIGLFSCSSDATATDTAADTGEEAKAVTVAEVEKEGLQVGDKAPDFELKNIDGKMYSLKDIKAADGEEAKGYIVTFTCNTCPYAVANEDRLIELHNKMAAKGYPVVAIQPNDPDVQPGDSFAKMKQRAEEKGFPFVYLLDEGQEVYPVYGATRTPEIYLLDSDLVVRYTGAIDDSVRDPEGVSVNYVIEAVEAIENGEQPSPALTKAIGCSIKTKKS